MEELPAVQLAQHLQDARDLAAGHGLRPPRARAAQEGPQVTLARVLQDQAVEDAAVLDEREGVEDADGARVAVQQLAELGLAHPAVHALADLDADGRRHTREGAQAAGQVDLAETTLAEELADAVAHPALRARDDVAGGEEVARQLPGA